MIKYRIDRKTPDYITLDMNDFLHSFSIDTLLEEGLEETFKMVNGIREFECQIKQCVYEFKIRKDSVLGRYLMKNWEEPFVAFEDGEWTFKTLGEEQKRILKNKEVPYEED